MADGPKILVVDDELDVLLLCRVNLEYEGYHVLEAKDGYEALRKVREDPPDLVLLDVMMTGMDGWQVLSQLKSDPKFASIPVIMLTAKVTERDQITGLTGGAVDYITKPFNPVSLSRAVRDVLEMKSPEEIDRRKQQTLEKLRLIDTEDVLDSEADIR